MTNEALKRYKDASLAYFRALPEPAFVTECAEELDVARKIFFNHPVIDRLREEVLPFLYDDSGFGVEHSRNTAIDAGAIVMVEHRGRELTRPRELALCAEVAGLLHDIGRLEPDHAARAAELARHMLERYPLAAGDRKRIVYAVARHHAPPLVDTMASAEDLEAELLAGAIHDADLFRFGPDIYASLLWETCDYEEANAELLLECFRRGLAELDGAEETFRTAPGQQYGPEFLDYGRRHGPAILRLLHEHLRRASPRP